MSKKGAKVAVPTTTVKRIQKTIDKSLKIQTFDKDNEYPQRVAKAIDASGTATSCTKLFKKHLRGRGFSNKDIEKLVVNKNGQTLGDIHSLLCEDYAYFNGYCYHVQYNALLS